MSSHRGEKGSGRKSDLPGSPPSQAVAGPRMPARVLPPAPPHPADLRDGGGHLGEVLVPAGHMPPGVVADAGPWAALGGRVPRWAQQQQQEKQQDRGDALGTRREGGSPLFQGPGAHIVHSLSPGSGPSAPGKMSPPPPPRSRASISRFTPEETEAEVTWHLPLAVRPC